MNSGKCPRKDECPFKHIADQKQLVHQRSNFVENLAKKRKILQLGHDHENDDLKSRHARAKIFTDFISENFEDKNIKNIADVAGGKGDLAFQLIAELKMVEKVLIVDPKARILRKKWQKKLLTKRKIDENRIEMIEKLFNDETFEEIDLSKVTLITGMHPDEATEEIVDQGLKRKIPFAIVPCCVFTREFSQTRSEIRTYEQFIDYLKEKNPEIREKKLGFRGRDKVLYWKP